ncbi:MAG TPA: sugar phosphate isomerase/epimerase, partial [Alphaproteobacteria bacterium]|nr:sugar phosphate isomerase/epimerase [Alphaproteobacteria bacterium]
MDRRRFLIRGAGALAGLGLAARTPGRDAPSALAASAGRPTGAAGPPLYRVSLAQWSLHRTLRAGELDPLDFPAFARERFGLDAVEYVSTFLVGRARRRSLLIMVDGEGRLGDPDPAARRRAVADHHPWVDAARRLGCHSIRVNASTEGPPEEAAALAADGLRRLAEYAAPLGLNVIVENHG